MTQPMKLKSASEVRDDILRTFRGAIKEHGHGDVNVTPKSDFYALAQAIGDECEVAFSNVQVLADRQMPDTATGEDLDRLVANMPMDPRKEAQGASGFILVDTSAPTNVSEGDELTGGNGLRYAVTRTETVPPAGVIPIVAVDTGAETNLGEGETLRWVRIPAFAAPTAIVGTGGLDGGRDSEGDEELRARLLAVYRNPPRSGNTGDINRIAEQSSPTVQKAFTYPALFGPGSYGVSVMAAPAATNKNRDIAIATVWDVITPAIEAVFPEHAQANVTTVENVANDVTFETEDKIWRDPSPWPLPGPIDSVWTWARAEVTEIVPLLPDAPPEDKRYRIRVRCLSSPTPYTTHLAWLSTSEWTVKRAVVTRVRSFANNIADIELDAPVPNLAAGAILMPDADALDDVFASVLDVFASLGPGERRPNAETLRCERVPRPTENWPRTISRRVLRAVRARTGIDVNIVRESCPTPPTPPEPGNPPAILVPGRIAIYPSSEE
ncbi:MAG: baseplate J/gp47 family protein [Polyangiaceae bacterium]